MHDSIFNVITSFLLNVKCMRYTLEENPWQQRKSSSEYYAVLLSFFMTALSYMQRLSITKNAFMETGSTFSV